MKKYHMLLAAPFALLAVLIGVTACQPQAKAPEEFFVLGNDGLHCDTELAVMTQMYMAIDPVLKGKLAEGCRFAGKGHIVKVLTRSINKVDLQVDLNGKPVWVMWVSVTDRAEDLRVSPPKYERIPAPEPVLTEMQKGKQYL